MTLLTICQNAADEIGVIRPQSIVSNADPDAQKLLRLANKVGTYLMKTAPWQRLRKEKTFTGVSGETQTSILPSDFDRFIPETFWNRTDRTLISGPASAVQWQGFKANLYDDTQRPKFIYRGGDVLILPALSGGESLAFEYVSNEWCTDASSTGQASFAADTDVSLFDEDMHTCGLVYEYLETEGLPSASAGTNYLRYVNTELDNDQPNAGILAAGDIFGGGRHFTGAPVVNGSNSLF